MDVTQCSATIVGTSKGPIRILDDVLHERMYGEHSFVLNSIFRNSEKAISSLKQGEHLNDTVITYFMKSLTASFPSKSKHTIDTFFLRQIHNDRRDDNRSLQRIEKVFTKCFEDHQFSKHIFIPINPNGDHWSLMIIDIDKHQFEHYCSIRTKLYDYRRTKRMITLMGKVLNDLLPIHKRGVWQSINHQDIPLQRDSFSCGIFLCIFAKCLYFEEPIKMSNQMLTDVRILLRDKFSIGQKSGFITFKESCWNNSSSNELRQHLLSNAECNICFKRNVDGVVIEGRKGMFLKFCKTCEGNLNCSIDNFREKFSQGNFDTCFSCAGKKMPMAAYHSVKTILHFCRTCVIKGNCICNTCKFPVIDVQIMNNFLLVWNKARTHFIRNRVNKSGQALHINIFLDRNQSLEESLIEHEFEVVDHEEHKGKFAFFNPNVTYADMYELLWGLGNFDVYVKQTVMRMFFQLIERRYQSTKKFACFVNVGKLQAAFERIGSQTSYGIFDLDRFVYTSLVGDMWISVCAVRLDFLKYEILCWVPSEDWTEKSERLTSLVARTLRLTWNDITKQKADTNKTVEYNISYYTDKSDPGRKRDTRDSGIYSMYYSYLFILDKRLEISPKQIHKLRRLAFLSIVSMDCQYGFIRLPMKASKKKNKK